MSIVKPFTFVAGTKAKAGEVNDNFDILYTQVNANITNIANVEGELQTLSSTKANINGDSTQRFTVADAVSSGDAINKRTLFNQISNTIDYIGGLTISKDSGSPNDTILIDQGAAYDSTKEVVLKLDVLTSKQNSHQSANTAYYVYIIGNATSSSVDILISTEPNVPALPTSYTRYRKIGSYTTDDNGNISVIYSLSNNVSSTIWNNAFPSNSYTPLSWTNEAQYIAPRNGWFVASGTFAEGGFGIYNKATGLGNSTLNNSGARNTGYVSVQAAKGQTVIAYTTYGGATISYFRFVYAEGDV